MNQPTQEAQPRILAISNPIQHFAALFSPNGKTIPQSPCSWDTGLSAAGAALHPTDSLQCQGRVPKDRKEGRVEQLHTCLQQLHLQPWVPAPLGEVLPRTVQHAARVTQGTG